MILSKQSNFTPAAVEPLEPRSLLSASVSALGAPINVSRLAGNQAEESIAIDPTNPQRMFLASNLSGASMLGAISNDGRATWARPPFATGNDGIPRALSAPSAAFDAFGNLFFA